MALYRAFTVGRLRCSGASPKISIAGYQSEGYVLVIRKDSTRKFCLQCIKDFVKSRPLTVTEDKNYLTIHSV